MAGELHDNEVTCDKIHMHLTSVLSAPRVRELDEFVDELFINNIVGKCKNPRSDVLKFFGDDVKLRKLEMNETVLCFNSFVKTVTKRLETTTSWQWKRLNSGSYYDGTKVSRPDEMDCMFVPQLGDLYVSTEGAPPGFCYVRQQQRLPSLEHLCDNGYLSAAYFREYVFSSLEGLLQNKKLSRDMTTKEGCPAYCVNYDTGLQYGDGSPRILSIDLVPALYFSGWPDTARDLSTTTLPDRLKKSAEGFHVVAKLYDKENIDDGHLLWRLSFSKTEKILTKHADSFGTDESEMEEPTTANGDSKTCRKKVLRILKRALEVIKTPDDMTQAASNSSSDITRALSTATLYTRQHGFLVEEHKFTTFQLRSLMWNEYYLSNLLDNDWHNDNLMTRLGCSIIKLKKILTGQLPMMHFFIRDYDVMTEVPVLEREYLYIMVSVIEKLI